MKPAIPYRGYLRRKLHSVPCVKCLAYKSCLKSKLKPGNVIRNPFHQIYLINTLDNVQSHGAPHLKSTPDYHNLTTRRKKSLDSVFFTFVVTYCKPSAYTFSRHGDSTSQRWSDTQLGNHWLSFTGVMKGGRGGRG